MNAESPTQTPLAMGQSSSGDDGLSEGVPQVEPTAVEVPLEFNPRPSQYNAAFRKLE